MEAGDALGQIEFGVLDAVHRGALRSRRTTRQIHVLQGNPAGETILHHTLHHCEQNGLLCSRRDASGRQYNLTTAGRARLRADRQFRAALIRVLARSG